MKSPLEDLIIATRTPSPSIYTSVGSPCGGNVNETPEEALARTIAAKEAELNSAKENVTLYDAGYWMKRVKAIEQEAYEIMTYRQYNQIQRDFYLNRPVEETTAEAFNEMLDVLPPLMWCTIKGVEMFCMCEMYTGTITNQYARVGKRYFTALVDARDKSTWICERLEGLL